MAVGAEAGGVQVYNSGLENGETIGRFEDLRREEKTLAVQTSTGRLQDCPLLTVKC